MNQQLTRKDKFIASGEKPPANAKYACRTCGLWVASTTGKAGHARKHPDHVMYSTLTGKDIGSRAKVARVHPVQQRTAKIPQVAFQSNGHLDATTRDSILDYVLAKAKEELNRELDRMFRELKSQPVKTSRPVYVAR